MNERVRTAGRKTGDFLRWCEAKPSLVIAFAAAATVGTSIALASYAGWPRTLHRLDKDHSWLWLILCLAGEVCAYAGYVLTVRDMARVDGGPGLSLGQSMRTVLGGFGVFAATRSSGGFAVDYWAFRRSGAGKRDALTRVLGLGFLEYATLSIGALGASALLFFRLDGHASNALTLPSLIAVPAFMAAIWVTSPKRVRRLSRPRTGRVRRPFGNAVAGASYVRRLLLSPREHGLGVLGNVVYWGGDIACLWAALQVVGGRITVAALVLGYSAGYVLTRRALPAGGAGVVELALTSALVGMGMHLVPALVGVIIYRVFNFWLPIIPALICMPSMRDLRGRMRRANVNVA